MTGGVVAGGVVTGEAVTGGVVGAEVMTGAETGEVSSVFVTATTGLVVDAVVPPSELVVVVPQAASARSRVGIRAVEQRRVFMAVSFRR